MTGEKHGKSLHKTDRKKCFRNRKIPKWLRSSSPEKAAGRNKHSEKCGFSLRKVLKKVEKLWIRREKFSTLHGKKLENDSKGEGKMPGNGKRKPKKTGFSFEKNSGKALKTREWDEKISQHWTKKYPDEAKKSRKRMIRMKEQQSFFCRQTTEKCRKRSRKKPKNLSSLSGKGMKNIRPHKDKSCHLRTVRSPETALSIGYSQGKKQKSSRSG